MAGRSPARGRPIRAASKDFIREIIDEHNRSGRFGGRVQTRFPPEPNGYLHIGHAKSICLNFGIAEDYGGQCNLRLDDTNPTKEEVEYVDSIKEDIRWLGFDWDDREYYASDYFEQLYQWAEQLVLAGKAYVCDLSADEVRQLPRLAHRARREQPLPQPLDRGEPGPIPADAGRGVPRRLPHAAGEDRHGLAEPQPPRPGDVPHPPRHAPPHGRRLVHLPHVRLRPRRVGLDRADHAFDLHAGVREPPAAVRLVRRAAGHLPSPADRVRPAEPDLHGDEQAAAAGAGQGGTASAAGTIPACPPSAACAAAATRRSRSALSASGSAWPSSTARSTWRCWSSASARTSTGGRRG